MKQWSVAVAVLAMMGGCSWSVVVVGHRGSPQAYPENTLPAFHAAVVAGADWVELDTRINADGTIYCLHDDTLDRTTDAPQVLGGEKILLARLDDAAVARLDAGAWFNPRCAGLAVPRLADAVSIIQNNAVTLLERKDGSAAAYAAFLRERELVGKLVVQSFDWDFLAELHDLLPEQPLGVLGGKPLDAERLARLERTGATYVAWSHKHLTRAAIAQLHDRGYQVLAYTVNDPADWRRLVRDGVDGVITDRPGDLRAWINTRRLWL